MDAVIRRMVSDDLETLVDIWLRSVRATHTFLSPADIDFYHPMVRQALGSGELDVFVLTSGSAGMMGFMAMSGNRIEALFLDPGKQRQGGGRQFVAYARTLHSDLELDVNEQNGAARAFYEACGFVVTGRSELDPTGRPFPLLHMRLAPLEPAS